jgi:hypothetical protein
VLYVADDVTSQWQPLLTDAVRLSPLPEPFTTRVSANVGAGFFAVRYPFPQPVDLNETPILELPLAVADNARVNVHVETTTGSWMIPLSAPLNRTKSLLTPAYQRGEQFRVPDFSQNDLAAMCLAPADASAAALKIDLLEQLLARTSDPGLLVALAIGNTSNAQYLLAGARANRAGASYDVGIPVLRAR